MGTTRKKSAGILLYRRSNSFPEVFLVHPGGPFWKNRDEGSWSVPKGEYENEDPLTAAIREFGEETGMNLSAINRGNFFQLQEVKLKSGKQVIAFAIEHDLDPGKINSNMFSIEWPPHSGNVKSFPEIDRGEWFSIDAARIKINSGQIPLLEELERYISRQ